MVSERTTASSPCTEKYQSSEEDDAPEPREGWTWSESDGQAILPKYTRDADEFTFHVYKASGLSSDDLLVTGARKDAVLYYLRLPTSVSHSWSDVVLYEGFKNGPVVARFTKPHLFSRSNITVTWYPTRSGTITSFILRTSELVGGNHAFEIPSTGLKVEWEMPLLKKHMRLVDLASKECLATFDETVGSPKKVGRLSVSSRLVEHFSLEVVLLTCLALERHRKQKRAEMTLALFGF